MFVASFFTQLGAVEFSECLHRLGDHQARMIPVPRKISISCGTGVKFSLSFDENTMNNPDLDSIYQVDQGNYTKIWSQDD